MKTLLGIFITMGHRANDSERERLKKSSLLVMSAPFALAGFLWGILYFYNGLIIPGLIPFSYSILSLLSIAHFCHTGTYRVFRFSQLLLILILPFALQIGLGGFVAGSAVMVWALVAPLGALIFSNRRVALYWFIAFVVMVLLVALIDHKLSNMINWQLRETFIIRLFALNMIGFSSIIFTSQYFFLTKQHLLIRLFEEKNQWIKEAFEAYISPNIVDHLLRNPDQLKLSGERRECSFVFTDLIGFTGMVEKSDPELIMTSLNEYLASMTKIIFKHEGTIQKIVGDAIAVMFSAPVIQDDHALRAVQCAMEMKAFGERFAALKAAQGFSFGRTRIGVHTGEVIVGNFGSAKQFDYRAFGDAINTTARLESVNKHLGTTICVSAATVQQCPGFYGRRIGALILKGKTKPVHTYEPLQVSQITSPHIRLYRKAFGLIEQSVAKSILVFERLLSGYPNDALAAFHLNRLRTGESGTIIRMYKK